jgi:ABC-type amino acid transport substrate-binding protein
MRRVFLVLGAVMVLFLAGCTEAGANELVVGLECNYAPFNWTTSEATDTAVEIDGVDAYCDGYDVMIASEIATALEMDLVIRKIEWDGLIPALIADEIDVIIAGMSPTPERAQTVSFTNEYFRSEQVLVVQTAGAYSSATTLADFDGASVIAQMGTLQDGLIDQISNVNHMNPLGDYPSLVASLTSNVSDALVAELPVAMSIVSSNAGLSIVQLGANGFTVEDSDVSVSVALRQDETELLESINTVLAGITTDSRNTMMNQALDMQP